jgi:hypothetical protein
LLLYAVYFGSAVLGSVQLDGFLPCRAGLVVLADGQERVAESVEDGRDFVGIAEFSVQSEGLLVVGNSQPVR